MTTMKAIVQFKYGDPDVLRLTTIQKPVPKAHEVLIRVQGASVNYADLLTRKGLYHATDTVFPFSCGLDAMGIIEEVGANVTHIKIGQRVIAFPNSGSYAQFIVASDKLVFPIPDELDTEQAIATPLIAFTAHMALVKIAQLENKETILVHGAAGGLGSMVIQMAKLMGATVIGSVRRPEQVKKVLHLGADFVIETDKENFAERVNDITNGNGADIIIDSLGGPYPTIGLGCLAPYGRMIILNSSSGPYAQIDTKLLHGSCRSIRGFSIGSTRRLKPDWFIDTANQVIPLLSSNTIKVPIAKSYSFEDASKAHKLLESRSTSGKIILRMD